MYTHTSILTHPKHMLNTGEKNNIPKARFKKEIKTAY